MAEHCASEGADTNVREALSFARQLAREEIDSIERIHRRTLLSFAYLGIFVAAMAAVIGYIGYANLRNAAIATAENETRTEVAHQIQEKLTQENVEGIVTQQVRIYSATKMSDAVHRELMTPEESKMIRAAADDEARNQVKQQLAPRHFSKDQSDAFVKAVNAAPDLAGYPVELMPDFLSTEARQFTAELSKSIALTKLKVIIGFPGFNADATDGVAIYRDQTSPEIYARKLQEAFLESGVDAKIISAPSSAPAPDGQKVPMVIYIGNRF